MDNLTKPDLPDRSKIKMSEDFELKHWLKALGVRRRLSVSRQFGNAAAAVRKELAVPKK